MRTRPTLVALLVLSFAVGLPTGAQLTNDLRIVVNKDNPTASLSKSQISDLFMKDQRTWPDGSEAQPIDQRPDAPARKSFSEQIHDRSVAAIRAHWLRRIFQGEDVPPPTRETEQEILAFVAANPGAIGYVSSRVALGTQVEILEVSD